MRLRSISAPLFGVGIVALTLAAGCTKRGFLEAPKADDEVSQSVGSFSADTHFLLEPSGSGEELLGRAVQISSSGGWTIADERAPGCEVVVEREVAEYEKEYSVALDDMTTMAAGYRDLLGLSARYGRSVSAEYKIQNQGILRADTRGPCGDVIVSSVRIGAGERSLVRQAAGEVKGGAGKGDIGARAGRSGNTKAIESMRWSTPQAYAFTFKRLGEDNALDLDLRAPSRLREGEALTLEIKVDQPAYIVVLYLEAAGPGGVLWPGPDLELPKADADAPLLLPPMGAEPLVAALREPGVAASETLVIYAFTEEADFDRLRPRGAVDGVDYAASLTRELAALPLSRWARTTLTYVIEPAAGAAAPTP